MLARRSRRVCVDTRRGMRWRLRRSHRALVVTNAQYWFANWRRRAALWKSRRRWLERRSTVARLRRTTGAARELERGAGILAWAQRRLPTEAEGECAVTGCRRKLWEWTARTSFPFGIRDRPTRNTRSHGLAEQVLRGALRARRACGGRRSGSSSRRSAPTLSGFGPAQLGRVKFPYVLHTDSETQKSASRIQPRWRLAARRAGGAHGTARRDAIRGAQALLVGHGPPTIEVYKLNDSRPGSRHGFLSDVDDPTIRGIAATTPSPTSTRGRKPIFALGVVGMPGQAAAEVIGGSRRRGVVCAEAGSRSGGHSSTAERSGMVAPASSPGKSDNSTAKPGSSSWQTVGVGHPSAGVKRASSRRRYPR